MESIVAILGIPYDGDSSYLKGTRLAPAEIRSAIHSPSSNSFSENETDLSDHPQLEDVGDLELTGDDVRLQIESGVAGLLQNGRRVLSLGGDHSISYPILKAHAARFGPVNLLQFDAHADLYDELDGNRFSHACPFARAHEDGLIKRHVQVGIRTMTHHQREQAERFGVQVVSMQGLPNWRPDFDEPIYLTLDLDVLDPAFAPGISHYEPGGLSVRELLSLIQQIQVPVIGADVVELNPSRDLHGMTAMVAAKLAKELLVKMIS